MGNRIFALWKAEALAHILGRAGQVVATGGGAVLAESNRACMLQNGFVVALKASPEIDYSKSEQRYQSSFAAGEFRRTRSYAA